MTPKLSASVFISCIFYIVYMSTKLLLTFRRTMIWDAEYFAGGVWIRPEHSSAFIMSSSFPAQFSEYISCFRTTSPIKWLSETGGIWRQLVCRTYLCLFNSFVVFHFCSCEELYSDKGILFFCGHKLSVPGFSVCVKKNAGSAGRFPVAKRKSAVWRIFS